MNVQHAARIAAEHPELVQQSQQQLQALLSRSATDPDFRRRLLTEPRAALADFTGQPVPESFNVKFVENTADATIVLPDPVDPAAELSDAELETVAGGGTPAIFVAVVVVGGAVWQAYQEGQEDACKCK